MNYRTYFNKTSTKKLCQPNSRWMPQLINFGKDGNNVVNVTNNGVKFGGHNRLSGIFG